MGLPRAMRICSVTLRGAVDRVRQPGWPPELVVKAGSHQDDGGRCVQGTRYTTLSRDAEHASENPNFGG